MRILATLSLALIAGLFTSCPALGQNLERKPLNVAGTLKGVAPGVIQVEASEKEVWLLKVEAKPEDVSFTGSAEKSFLQPGMFLEFRSPVNKRGMVLEPIASLTVFTPSEARAPGVQADGDLGGGGGALFNEGKEEKKGEAKEKKAPKGKGDDTVYLVRGAISKIGRAGDVTVSAAGAQVKFNLAEDCKISVEVNELSYVALGDKVTVQGWYIEDQPGQGAASKIEVSAAKPLTSGVKKKPTKPVKEAKTPAKGAKGAKGAKEDKEEKPSEEKKDEAKKEEDKKGTEKTEPKKDE
jgi:hypothetical protein